MPIVIPPFVQYQAPMPPLRGLWNSIPPEGDRFVSAEIDWSITTGPGMAVQFSLSGNSPVAFSQIVAFSVDNSRCAVDVQFLFPDSGFILVVPGYSQGVYPVFTNALMFYATAAGAALGDTTTFQVLNSMPPPVAIQVSQEQAHATIGTISLTTNATTTVIPAPVSGTIENLSVVFAVGAGSGSAVVSLIDGASNVIWTSSIVQSTAVQDYSVNLNGMKIRFYNGLNFVVAGSTITGGSANVNVYYGVP